MGKNYLWLKYVHGPYYVELKGDKGNILTLTYNDSISIYIRKSNTNDKESVDSLIREFFSLIRCIEYDFKYYKHTSYYRP